MPARSRLSCEPHRHISNLALTAVPPYVSGMTDYPQNITDMIDDFSFLDDWEDTYAHIIDLGKSLPAFDDAWRTSERLVKGCQSSVWIQPGSEQDATKGEVLTFAVDSDAIIVRGLLGLVLAALDHKTPQEILDFDITAYFEELDLERHLSPTRGNGLRSIVGRIKSIAQVAA